MKKFLWIGGGIIVATTATGIFLATQNPKWIAGVIAGLGAALWKALAPGIAKMFDHSEETDKGNQQRIREGQQPKMGRDLKKPARKVKANWKGAP